ncbi:alanine:cation symporter family protein [Proteus cibarius]|uniref:Alanine:cation symporter family protein n=1 Tax=Proteus terrae subsp. cibarius TaxID=626774 RepID=A0A6G6SXH9_9GAMM|nr:sodium:alanine symporter family protein [Proteus terrae]QHP76837.1 alanine:cation symporter family protein [Proteus vulgaris]MBG2915044.1 alanine:cation symporter family protein [Proteus terrae subsp. cibarius]MBG3090960.1 alanine:cation symporter family protein [Proteus terrae subsp. cibarius]MBG6037093.1 alanine:cation symporter family protein [Proteus terrae subsp. cibarius]QGW03586.1 alanine:cation symporter family protein [Proteus terrae subsp. cibarius]
MTGLINFANNILWGYVLIYLLLGVGIYFTIRTGFIQIRHFSHMFSILKNSHKSDKSGISSFQALCTSLAARVGTGNLTGVAIALTAGGPGAIFWMWVVALIGMATSLIESTLAQLYKTKDDDGNYRGGPAYYMTKGLKMRWMGVLFAIFLIIAFGLVFNAVQANSIAQATASAFNFDPLYVGIFLVLTSGFIIFGGLRWIARVAELVVPIMAMAYLLLAFWVVADHIERLPEVFILIFKSAFGLQEAAAGAIAYGISQAMTQGIQRGLFSNEAGMGSAPNAAASATPYPPHPASQGYIQMLGVFMDTLVICSATAVIILSSGVLDSYPEGINGIQLTQLALSSSVGGWGSTFIAIAIFFFAFTSIIANYAYAESNMIFLGRNHTTGLFLLRSAALAMVMFGALADMPLVWKMADLSMGLMAMTNLIAIILLSGVALKLVKDYNQQRQAGLLPTFDIRQYPELQDDIEKGIWDENIIPDEPLVRCEKVGNN